MKHVIKTDQAPTAASPFSQGWRAGDFVYTCGCGGEDPVTGELVGPGIEEQTRQTLRNIEAILNAAGAKLSDVIKVTAHLTDLNNAPIYNRVYAEFFPGDKPARTTVGSQLLGGFLVEIDVVAYTGG